MSEVEGVAYAVSVECVRNVYNRRCLRRLGLSNADEGVALNDCYIKPLEKDVFLDPAVNRVMHRRVQ